VCRKMWLMLCFCLLIMLFYIRPGNLGDKIRTSYFCVDCVDCFTIFSIYWTRWSNEGINQRRFASKIMCQLLRILCSPLNDVQSRSLNVNVVLDNKSCILRIEYTLH